MGYAVEVDGPTHFLKVGIHILAHQVLITPNLGGLDPSSRKGGQIRERMILIAIASCGLLCAADAKSAILSKGCPFFFAYLRICEDTDQSTRPLIEVFACKRLSATLCG